MCFPAGILNTWLIWQFITAVKDSDKLPADNFACSPGRFYSDRFVEPIGTVMYSFFLAIYLFLFLRRKTEFNEPMDAIVYGTVISLGFATLENFEYVYFPTVEGSVDIAILRAFTAIPLHASCGIVMGYFFGKYLFSGTKSYLVMSLLLPVFFHSLYNFLCTYSTAGMLVLLFLLIRYCYFLHQSFVRDQQLKLVEEEQKSI